MKIIADENIPFVKEAFSHLGEVETMAGRAITREKMGDAECLLVRSVTKVNADLLEGNRIRFVGTATAGTDHVDEDWLRANGIHFAFAPGSNANSVAEYVVTGLLHFAVHNKVQLAGKSIGIIGVGNVGKLVEKKVLALGMLPLLNDPLLRDATGDAKYRPLEEMLGCDFITFHTPLTKTGPYPTYHLADRAFFQKLRKGCVLINAARGGVVETSALKEALANGTVCAAILDVWEGEPVVDRELLEKAWLATPHIAGYSFDGKVRGTEMIYEAACEFFGAETRWKARQSMPAPENPVIRFDANGCVTESLLLDAVLRAYDLPADDMMFRKTLSMPVEQQGDYFTELRKKYPVRREFEMFRVEGDDSDVRALDLLNGMGFEARIGGASDAEER